MKKDTPFPFLSWYMGLLLLGGPLILLYHTVHIQNVVLCIPFLVASIFFLSVVQVSLSGDHLRYRRFLKWRVIPYKEIRNCRMHWVFGYLKTTRFLAPWGGVYFTLKPSGFRWDLELISAIRRKAKLD